MVETDVVVVGGGGSGLAAAIEAARFGQQVVLLEKNDKVGGTTILAVGSVTSTCTNLQREKGIRDVPESHFEDMALFAGDLLPKDNPDLRRVLVENVTDTVSWLEDAGVVLSGPLPEPPHRQPRMHNVLPNSRSYAYNLERMAIKLGVDIRLHARASKLIREQGRVVGVDAEFNGAIQRFNARKGVILACGDYSSNREFKATYVADNIARVEGINPSSTGDGHRLAIEAGAEIVNGDVMLGPEIRFVAPPRKTILDMIPPIRPIALAMRWSFNLMPSWLLRPFLMMFVTTNLAPTHRLFEEGAILVNKDGKRFVDERARPQFAIPDQPEGVAYIVFGRRVAEKFSAWPFFISTAPGVAYAYLPDYRRNRKDIYKRGSTVTALARGIGVPLPTLADTIREHNQSGVSADSILEPPFYALGPVKSWIVLTDGGARVTSRLEVLDRNKQVIPGLYAVGSNGQGGLLLEGHGHHLGWAFTSGRLAGRYAAMAHSPPAGTGETL